MLFSFDKGQTGVKVRETGAPGTVVSGHRGQLSPWQAEVGGHCPLLGQIRREELRPVMVATRRTGSGVPDYLL